MTATESAVALIKKPSHASDDQLIAAVKQIIGYMPAVAIAGQVYNPSDFRTDISSLGHLLK